MKTQAWGWLAAAVLAAGLNASYHDGGLRWAHVAANRIEHSSAAVLALAGGHVEQFVVEARLVSEPMLSQPLLSDPAPSDPAASDRLIAESVQMSSCPWSSAVARAQTRVAHAEIRMAHFQAMSARRQAELDRFEANRERFVARIQAETDHLRSIRVNPAVMESIERSDRCQRIHVSVPHMPEMHITAPEVHLDLPGDPL